MNKSTDNMTINMTRTTIKISNYHLYDNKNGYNFHLVFI